MVAGAGGQTGASGTTGLPGQTGSTGSSGETGATGGQASLLMSPPHVHALSGCKQVLLDFQRLYLLPLPMTI